MAQNRHTTVVMLRSVVNQSFRNRPRVVPDRSPGLRIKRERIVGGRQKHQAAHHYRRNFKPVRVLRMECPLRAKQRRISRSNFLERAVSASRVVAVVGGPVRRHWTHQEMLIPHVNRGGNGSCGFVFGRTEHRCRDRYRPAREQPTCQARTAVRCTITGSECTNLPQSARHLETWIFYTTNLNAKSQGNYSRPNFATACSIDLSLSMWAYMECSLKSISCASCNTCGATPTGTTTTPSASATMKSSGFTGTPSHVTGIFVPANR